MEYPGSLCEFCGSDHLIPIFTDREAGGSKFGLWSKEGGREEGGRRMAVLRKSMTIFGYWGKEVGREISRK